VARRIYPLVVTVTEDGYQRLTDAEAGTYAQTVIDGRMSSPDGPSAQLRQT
jgi:proteasome beta subunit